MPSCRPEFASLRSYQAAYEFYQKAEPYRTKESARKKNDRYVTDTSDPNAKYRLEANQKRHMNVRLMSPADLDDLYRETFGTTESYHYSLRATHTEASRAQLEANLDKKHIAFQLYSTDVVVWREPAMERAGDEGVIFLDPYVSNSTNAFVSRLTPDGLHARWEPRACLVIVYDHAKNKHGMYSAEGRIYRVAGGRRVAFHYSLPPGGAGAQPAVLSPPSGSAGGGGSERAWTPVRGSGIEPWDRIVIDRKSVSSALKSERFADFSLWALGWAHMNDLPYLRKYPEIAKHASYEGRPGASTIMAYLRDPSQQGWERLARNPHFWPDLTPPDGRGFACENYIRLEERLRRDPKYAARLHAKKLSEAVRMAIYETHGVGRVETTDYLVGYDSVRSFYLKEEKYTWVR